MMLVIWIASLPVMTSCTGGNKNMTAAYKPCYTPEYATGFSIDSIDGMKSTVITVIDPWQGADSIANRLFVARNGEQAPRGFEGQCVKTPVKRIVTMSSTHIAMLDAIGETGSIVGVSGLDYVSNPDINSRREEIGDVGYDGNVNYELLLSLDPDIVLLFGVNGASPMEKKLDELAIPYMYVGDYVEESPLGKAEWMIALGELTDKREEATIRFEDIAFEYNSLSNRIGGQGLEPPRVMLNTPYGDSWFLPPSKSYMVTLITDASGEYVYSDNSSDSSVPVDMEKAYLLTSGASRWINISNASSLDELKRLYPKFAGTPPVTTGEVYANTRRMTPSGGNDFYESGIVHPELILRDLVKIMHPELMSDQPFIYYKRLE